MIKKKVSEKQLFLCAVIVCFVTILVYELLTPIFSDDLGYFRRVKEATGWIDLVRQEKEQYMGWTGRSVVHLLMRVFMYIGSMPFFRVVASLVFTGLTVLMYRLSEGRNAASYLFGVLLMWVFGVSFAQTVLWMTGACNYLFGTTIILADMMLYHKRNRNVALSVILGLLAGWCNENTSGGLLLYAVLLLLWRIKKEKETVPFAHYAGIAANLIGFLFMILAPGNFGRAAMKEAKNAGLMAIAVRLLEVTDAVYRLFFPLLIAAIVLGFLLHARGKLFDETKRFYLYLLLFAATSYSLVLAPGTADRAFFGAGVFLFIALMHGLDLLTDAQGSGGNPYTPWKSILVSGMLLYMGFTYISNGAKLFFIQREITERMDYLQAQADKGLEESGAAILREQFDSRYSVAYEMDIEEDWRYWINAQYAEYYGFHLVWGVPRDAWTEY